MSSSRNNEARIYVGNLPPDIRTKDIEDLFYKFGKIAYIDLKNRRGPPFAFVEFEDPRYESNPISIYKRTIVMYC
jgi:arginine/serine-rich splicing factor 1/9